jgi:murein L,D-transpeptidase YcbB/YkuD
MNMERWRWMPRDLGSRYLMVNLPAFELTLVEEGKPELRMRAIVGSTERTSPALQSRVVRMVFNPDWTVPTRIAVEDMLPILRRDPSYLLRKQIKVMQKLDGEFVEVDPLQVDWRRYHKDDFPFILIQAPSPQNSLGRLKFVMPNSFSVFIHDTPTRGLFAKSVRALSSGCIRIEEPVALASRLSGVDDPLAAELDIQVRIAEGETTELPVTPAIPVYLVYLTSWVDEAGNLQFRNDVYGRNRLLRDRFSVH